jgi:uncharacterized SAM-binding protein YcdF (DUF218 family)
MTGKEEASPVRLNEGIQKRLGKLVKGTPDAFFVLVGPIQFNEQKGRYVSSSFGAGDENSARALGTALPAGGRDRVLATAEMSHVFPNAFVVSMTRSRDEHRPTIASVVARELIMKGVDEDHVLLEEVSVDTITEYKEAAKFWKDKGWRNIIFILAEWHVPRATALFNHIEDFADTDEEKQLISEFVEAIKSGALTVQFLDTTKVLSTRSSKYKWFFEEKLAQNPGMQARIAAEKKGVAQIAAGAYAGKTLTHKIWEDKP